ncbi:S8 family peptidase [Arthrobacter sp. Br18]|uniref:S8 family peptidase n=1 Tax=Arthrobacter sp. Br18 TaxID=1312954 RepID=UPI0006851C93|nr:S8 family peptidase [Arthrobacter sp. Br18]
MRSLNSWVLVVAALVATDLPGLPAQAAGESEQQFIVTFDSGVDERSRAAVESAGATPLEELKFAGSLVVAVPDSAVAERLRRADGVSAVEADARVAAAAPIRCSPWPSCGDGTGPALPPSQILPWGIDRVDAAESWSTSRGTGVKVAVIDTGIDRSHPDLEENLAGGVNYVAGPGGPGEAPDPAAWNDDNGHGTHLAGTIAASDNTIGVVGVAPEADLYGVKVLNGAGYGYASDVALGIEWSINNGMQVINLSLGEGSDVPVLRDAIEAADRAGIVVVAAAGNLGDGDPSTDDVLWPAQYDSVLAVAATDAGDSAAGFSSDGGKVEIAAPGVDVLSSTRGGGYGTMNGTSTAAPHVSGVVAGMLAAPVNPGADSNKDGRWSTGELRAWLQVTADDLGAPGRDVSHGYGLLDAEEAITGVQGP